MGFRIITIPFELNKMEFSEDELNKFIVNKKINSYKAEFFQRGGAAIGASMPTTAGLQIATTT